MRRRTAVFLPVLLTIAALAAFGRFMRPTRAQQTNRVGLVVDFGDHHITRCVEFSESKITGYDVLRRAGLDVVADTSNPMGVIICDINDTSGCPPSNCFCECQGSPCVYWAYYRLVGGSWQYSQLGASSQKVGHGAVEGWAWGEGSLNSSGAKPPLKTFDEICAPPTNTPAPPTSTPKPTDTPQPESELVVWFRLDDNPVPVGSCTMLRWDTTNAQKVYLDGEEVSPIGDREVCPTEPQEYDLRVVGPEDEEIHTLVLGVSGDSPASPTAEPTTVPPSPTPSAQATATATPSPTLSRTELPTATPSPSPTPEATASPSSTPSQPTETSPAPTATELAQSDTADAPSEDVEESASFYRPASYAAFALIVGGLVGWLIFLTKVRR
ncbi:MAG: hypothetical protein U9R72_05900 [Chloroflexota bacterium]|nr:hypothetical protein [Chloroflexota bacterium]